MQGTKLVSYTYDAWGNVSITYSNGGDLTGAQYNPFTYRGYYRDAETGFYYLNSRYYDPKVGRFINPDSFVSTGQGLTGYNMFAYCNNNPVIYVDYTGKSLIAFFLAGLTVGVTGGFILSFIFPPKDEINNMADEHYSRNELNKVENNLDEIKNTFEKQPESMDKYHENTKGQQGAEALYNDKYLSPEGGHYEIIICSPPGKNSYIVNQSIDPTNMGTYNYANNDEWVVFYGIKHFFMDMVPYYLFGNTREDKLGVLKWVID